MLLGLSQICSNFCPKYFQKFPRFSPIVLFSVPILPDYAPRLTSFLWNILICECSLLEYFTKELSNMHLSQFLLTALLGNINLFHGIKLHSLKYPPNMLALCWHQHSNLLCFITLAYLTQTIPHLHKTL